jgi:hypothetical protein
MKRNLTRFLAIFIAAFFTLQTIQLSHAQKRAAPPSPPAAPVAQVNPRAEVKETDNTPVGNTVRGGVRAPRPYATGSEVEPNDTSGTATAITFTPTAITTAAINPGGDLDFYTFTAPAGAKVWLETDTGGTQNAGATSRDTVVDLLAATARLKPAWPRSSPARR